MFRKLLDQGQAGDNVGCLLRGIEREGVERGQVLAKPGSITRTQTSKPKSMCSRRRRRPPHALLHELPTAILFPHDGRYRIVKLLKAPRWSSRRQCFDRRRADRAGRDGGD